MDKILSINTIKNVFAALGAKTSDSNYGVALLDKTTAEPKGLMGMSDLASVLGVIKSKLNTNLKDCKYQVAPGIYGLGADTVNAPFRYGKVIAFPHNNNNDQVKIAVNDSSGHKLAVMSGISDWWYFDDVSV